MTPAAAQSMHGVIEPLHALLYFVPEVQDRFAEAGLEPRSEGYFASRACALGPTSPHVVAATFFGFNPDMVHHVCGGLWDKVSPADAYRLRNEGIEALFERVDAPTDDLAEAIVLARAAGAAAEFAGRPLAAGNAAMPAPGTPWADLFQALTVLREHRGDGHVGLLVGAALHPVQVLAMMHRWPGSPVSRRFLQATRVWTDEHFDAADASLRELGWLDGDELTAEGLAWREQLEADTDRLALQPYRALGEDDTRRLFDLLLPIAEAVNAAGAYPRPFPLPDGWQG